MTDRPIQEREELSTEDLATAMRQPQTEANEAEVRGTPAERDDTVRSDAGTADEQSEKAAADMPSHDDDTGDREPLLPQTDIDDMRRRWDEVQFQFVDEPREAVSKADAMVADLAQRLITSFAAERERLESQWSSGDEVSTEELRVSLRRYRSFFERLLVA